MLACDPRARLVEPKQVENGRFQNSDDFRIRTISEFGRYQNSDDFERTKPVYIKFKNTDGRIGLLN